MRLHAVPAIVRRVDAACRLSTSSGMRRPYNSPHDPKQQRFGISDRGAGGKEMKAVRIHEFGEPEVMKVEEMPTPAPTDGQALVRVEAAGVNFMDIYQRTGMY